MAALGICLSVLTGTQKALKSTEIKRRYVIKTLHEQYQFICYECKPNEHFLHPHLYTFSYHNNNGLLKMIMCEC